MKKFLIPALLLLSVLPVISQQIDFVNAFPSLAFSYPVFMTNAHDNTNRIFVVDKNGFIRVFPNDSSTASYTNFLNVSNKISNEYAEKGLLGLAFHPNYSSNRYFYIFYTRLSDGALTVSRFTTQAGNPNKADSLSELILLTVPHPNNLNHNGGCLMFGQDGYLYIGMGDGGAGGDPPNNAQNKFSMLGKIHRIDVDNPSGGNNYGIPAGNPFANGVNGNKEIYTYGMRNPWRFSQDPVTGLIYCGDVGQDVYEEVDIIQGGNNYGWRIMEGLHCYNPSTGCNQTGLTLPIKEYHHTPECSITGGYVYRGSFVTWLTGRYIYGDYCSKKIWKLLYTGGTVSDTALIGTAPGAILSFGVDQNNELFVCCGDNKIYKIRNSVIGIQGNGNNIPDDYILAQNYPNPFNPSTEITYSIPKVSHVKLSIFNAIGQKIVSLADEDQKEGTYRAVWNASDLPSGIYFYQLEADNFSATKKMVLIK